jgi:predicted nucleic acid-binding protein
MTPIFLYTVGLLAVWDIDDQWHNAADAAYERIVSARQPVVTTTFVLLECGNAVARRTFAVMRRLGIRQAFTNDRHFQEAGFETLF